MNNEPGVNLARMVAAERNALAGLGLARSHADQLAAVETRIGKLESTVIVLRNELTQLRGQLAIAHGTGPTAT